MNEKEVKEFIGEDNFSDFIEWMHGQTVSMYEDGSTDYYSWDVKRFKEINNGI